MFRGHELPLVRIAILEGKPFRVRTVAQDDRVLSIRNRPENIGAQKDSIVHLDRYIPIDAHAVAYSRSMLHPSNSCASINLGEEASRRTFGPFNFIERSKEGHPP